MLNSEQFSSMEDVQSSHAVEDQYMKFEVFRVVNIKIVVSENMTMCSLVDMYLFVRLHSIISCL